MSARISKTSPITNLVHTMEFDLYDQDEFDLRLFAWRRGDKLLQEAFPELSNDALDFIRTGITPDEWYRYINSD